MYSEKWCAYVCIQYVYRVLMCVYDLCPGKDFLLLFLSAGISVFIFPVLEYKEVVTGFKQNRPLLLNDLCFHFEVVG